MQKLFCVIKCQSHFFFLILPTIIKFQVTNGYHFKTFVGSSSYSYIQILSSLLNFFFFSSSNNNIYDRLIGLVGRVFANGPGDMGLIPGRIIPKTLKMVLDTTLLNEGKVEQSRERSSALPYTLV